VSDVRESKPYDLHLRTRAFAKKVRAFVRTLPLPVAKSDDVRQLLRSSGSVGANLIEAGEGLSAKDRLMRMKICRKEAKESGYWLDLIDLAGLSGLDDARQSLLHEADELTRIFGKIVQNAERSKHD
jgi:four helix bundle protein